jgi:EAL domain-containing protein (putative c-di-GMP-specific phosphodiesterase class I)
MDKTLFEPFLHDIFRSFYETILQDSYLEHFFSSPEQVERLVEKQYRSLLDSMDETPEDRSERYLHLGVLHYEMGLSISDYVNGINYLEKSIMRELSDRGALNEHFCELAEFFNTVRQSSAEAYFYLKVQAMITQYESEMSNTLYYRLHVKWALEFLGCLAGEVSHNHSLKRAEKCTLKFQKDFAQWLGSNYVASTISSLRIREELVTLNESYSTIARSIGHHLSSGRFVEAYAMLESFAAISQNMMHLLNQSLLEHLSHKEHVFLDYLLEQGARGYVMILELKKLSLVHKYQGTDVADNLLDEVEKTIKSFVIALEDDILHARLSNNKFYFYFPERFSPDEMQSILDSMALLLLNMRIQFKEHTNNPDAVMGVVPLKAHLNRNQMEKLLHYVLSLANGKANHTCILTREDEETALGIIAKRQEDIYFIQNALHGDMLEVFFQPIVELESETISEVEVLARIYHEGNYIPAGAFIDLIYELDVVVELDIGILEKLRSLIGELKQINTNVFINISPQSLRSDRYIKNLKAFIHYFRSSGVEVFFELTEQAFLDNIELIKSLKEEENIVFAVDDFGTGYSSLGTVAELAENGVISHIKIDGSLVQNITRSEKIYQILDAASYMTEKLQLNNIAEFIEDEATCQKVKDLGIRYGQGYYFYKPMHIEQLLKAMSQR